MPLIFKSCVFIVLIISEPFGAWAGLTNNAFFSIDVVCDYLLDDARNQFLTQFFSYMNRQGGQLQFYTKQNNLRFMLTASCVSWHHHRMGVVSRNGWGGKLHCKSLVISMGFARGSGVESMTFFFNEVLILLIMAHVGFIEVALRDS
jgi:hypothetical protein